MSLNRRQHKATIEIERTIAGLFKALDLHLDYDTITIEKGKNSFGPWYVTIDNTNSTGDRVLCTSGRTLGEALGDAVGQAARSHLIASGEGGESE